MPPPPDLLETVTTLTTSLTTTSTSLQSPEFRTLLPPENGISLLDLENELLLSYIHIVVILLLLRPLSGTLSNIVSAEAIKELVKIRVMLERGVKPLEGKLKYQIDKVMRSCKTFCSGHYPPHPLGTPRTAHPAHPASPRTRCPNSTTLRRKSQMLDEFVTGELSTAPIAEPSVGSTIIDSHRVVKSARDRCEEWKRQEYVGNNFVRPLDVGKKKARERKCRCGPGGREASGRGREDRSSPTGNTERLMKRVDRVGKSAKVFERNWNRSGDGENEGGGGSGVIGESLERRKERVSRRMKT
ncbi:hypothetical protein HOY80DRAFT_1006069 [Tuber brumale]|nr:hypothetical protein HOY80DRAFT_1006069 [Tuber brumale]